MAEQPGMSFAHQNAAPLGGPPMHGNGAGEQNARKGFSASAFRNLAGRLKQPEPEVPVLVPNMQPSVPVTAVPAQAPPSVIAAPVVQAPAPVSEPTFGEKAAAQAADDAARQLIELQLETIWRMMLARPTPEDLEIYLREAAEIMADDPLYAEPPPELAAADGAPTEETGESGAMVRSFAPDDADIIASSSERARSLLDMMAAGAILPHERSLAADTLLRLLHRLDLPTLRLLAKRLAVMESPPSLLVANLIRDPRLEVSGPLLEDCNHILDRDLETVIKAKEPEKLKLIARRRNMNCGLSDKLMATGDVPAILQLLRNDDAQISHGGFLYALAVGSEVPDVLVPLLNRRDLSAALAFEAFWFAPAELRRLVISRFLTDSEALSKILRITVSTADKSAQIESGSSREHVMLESLERAVRGNPQQAADDISALLGVSHATVMRTFIDKGGEALVVLLRASGYPRSAVPGLLQRMRELESNFTKHTRSIDELQSMFETLSLNKARILLTYWDWAQTGTGPYAPLE